MGKLYEWGYNPFKDYLFDLMLKNVDISKTKTQKNIENDFYVILNYYLNNEKDIVYLDFDIIEIDDTYELVANNFISALWFSGLLPDDCEEVMNEGELIVDDHVYWFDDQQHKLKKEKV